MLACAQAAVLAPAAGAVPTGMPAGFGTTTELRGLTLPTRVAWAPDGRRFVTEKAGVLKVAPAGSNTAQTVLDIRTEVNSFQDRGLLGLAVDSNFASNGYVYLLYTYDLNRNTTNPGPDADAPAVSQLRRVKLNSSSQVVASQVILGTQSSGVCPSPSNDVDCIPSEGTSHSIGTVISAPDGTLYVGSGDASDYNIADPLSLRTYDERSLAGKIMHIDRDGKGLPTHPFCASETTLTKVCTKVYAKGFRNPFRFQLMPDGALLVGDVGWSTYEELDYVGSGGKSFGWPCYEGPIHTPTWKDKAECQPEYAKEGTPNAHVPPVHSYAHDSSAPSWAVVAGPEYTGDLYPAGYRGSVFWGDFGAGLLRRAQIGPTGQFGAVSNFAANWWEAVDLTSAPNGDIVWLEMNGWGDDGMVTRLVYTPGNASPTAVISASPKTGAAPLTVTLDGSGSNDSDGDALSYDWDFGDGSPHSTAAKPSHTFTNAGTYTVTLTVSDGRGRSDTDTVQVSASNSPPVPAIDVPAAGSLYRDGTPLTVTGSATDPDQGTLPGSAFSWLVALKHKDHQHVLTSPTGVKTFELTPVRDHDSDSYYVIRLTVTDSGGATASTEREIRPETVPLHFRSTPSGAPLSYAGTALTAPSDADAAIGFRATVTAAQSFVSDGLERNFVSWSDGGERVHDIEIPDSATTLTAVYDAPPIAHASATPTLAETGDAISFDGSGSSDPDGDALTYIWDFGDGSPATSDVAATHSFATPGDHVVTLTVSDADGATSTAAVHVRVDAQASDPPSGEGPPPDLQGPLFRPRRPASRPRALAGTVTDASSVRTVELAVARISRGRCRWVGGSPPRLRHAAACTPRRWIRAKLTGTRWRLSMPRRLPAGRYRAWLLAIDRHGNIGRLTAEGDGQLRFRVARGAAARGSCHAALLRRPLACQAFAR
jgi:glucose/arabinose dehydrogenase/PKD repeat protein